MVALEFTTALCGLRTFDMNMSVGCATVKVPRFVSTSLCCEFAQSLLAEMFSSHIVTFQSPGWFALTSSVCLLCCDGSGKHCAAVRACVGVVTMHVSFPNFAASGFCRSKSSA